MYIDVGLQDEIYTMTGLVCEYVDVEGAVGENKSKLVELWKPNLYILLTPTTTATIATINTMQHYSITFQ